MPRIVSECESVTSSAECVACTLETHSLIVGALMQWMGKGIWLGLRFVCFAMPTHSSQWGLALLESARVNTIIVANYHL